MYYHICVTIKLEEGIFDNQNKNLLGLEHNAVKRVKSL